MGWVFLFCKSCKECKIIVRKLQLINFKLNNFKINYKKFFVYEKKYYFVELWVYFYVFYMVWDGNLKVRMFRIFNVLKWFLFLVKELQKYELRRYIQEVKLVVWEDREVF